MMRNLIFIFSMVSFCVLNAQDIYLANQQQSLLSVNPSFAGSNGFIRAQANYRLTHHMFNTYLSYDMRIKNSGLAITYAHDNIESGLYKNDVFNITYAHYFYLGDKKVKLIPSIQAGGFVRNLDKSRLSFEDMRYQVGRHAFVRNWDYEPASQKSNFDVSAGLLMQHNKLIIGASIYHLTQPDMGLWGVEKLPALFNGYVSYNLITKKDLLFNFSSLFMTQQKFHMLKVMSKALLFKHYIIGVGTELQQSSDLICHYGYRHNYFTVSITSVFAFEELSYNRHEIGVSYTLRNKDQRKQLIAMENW